MFEVAGMDPMHLQDACVQSLLRLVPEIMAMMASQIRTLSAHVCASSTQGSLLTGRFSHSTLDSVLVHPVYVLCLCRRRCWEAAPR
jgi:hypothetical protein